MTRKPMTRTPEINIDDCIGCGACVDVCPEVFALNEAIDKALVLNPAGCPEERIQEAMDLCPVRCIIFWEE
jgi:ferredoxin